MFAITATFEDFQMHFTSETGEEWKGMLTDGFSGKSQKVSMTAKQMEHVMAFNLDTDGEPMASTLEERYEEMEKWVLENEEKWVLENEVPPELRPMP